MISEKIKKKFEKNKNNLPQVKVRTHVPLLNYKWFYQTGLAEHSKGNAL